MGEIGVVMDSISSLSLSKADMWDSLEAWGSTQTRRGQDSSHNENNTNSSFQKTLFIVNEVKKTKNKNSAYTSKITLVQTSIRHEIQALVHRNINRISRQTCTHTHTPTFRQACQKGAPLWNRTFSNCQEKHTPWASRAIPVLSNYFTFMTSKKVLLFLHYFGKYALWQKYPLVKWWFSALFNY